jgi:hypothetical protein
MMSLSRAKVRYLLIAVDKQTDDYIFDNFVEKLQEIVIEDEFEKLRDDFFQKYADVFDNQDENKLEYMDIFKKYTQIIESHIEKVGLKFLILGIRKENS